MGRLVFIPLLRGCVPPVVPEGSPPFVCESNAWEIP